MQTCPTYHEIIFDLPESTKEGAVTHTHTHKNGHFVNNLCCNRPDTCCSRRRVSVVFLGQTRVVVVFNRGTPQAHYKRFHFTFEVLISRATGLHHEMHVFFSLQLTLTVFNWAAANRHFMSQKAFPTYFFILSSKLEMGFIRAEYFFFLFLQFKQLQYSMFSIGTAPKIQIFHQ